LDEILTVSRLRGLPAELRRSLACTNIIENMMGAVHRVTRNVKRWSSSSTALRWTDAAMNKSRKAFAGSKLTSDFRHCGSRLPLPAKRNKQSRSCPNCEGRLPSFTATTASQSSTKHGAIPREVLESDGRLCLAARTWYEASNRSSARNVQRLRQKSSCEVLRDRLSSGKKATVT